MSMTFSGGWNRGEGSGRGERRERCGFVFGFDELGTLFLQWGDRALPDLVDAPGQDLSSGEFLLEGLFLFFKVCIPGFDYLGLFLGLVFFRITFWGDIGRY